MYQGINPHVLTMPLNILIFSQKLNETGLFLGYKMLDNFQ